MNNDVSTWLSVVYCDVMRGDTAAVVIIIFELVSVINDEIDFDTVDTDGSVDIVLEVENICSGNVDAAIVLLTVL